MRAIVYDLLQIVGLSLVAFGAGMQWGTPAGLMAAGGGLISLSVFDALMAARRPGGDSRDLQA